MRIAPIGVVIAALSVFAASPASAAETAPLSALPRLAAPPETKEPKKYGVPGLTVKEMPGHGGSAYTELVAAKGHGYCIANKEYGLRLSSSSSGTESEIWRLIESDGKVTLEQTRFEVASYLKNAWVKSRATIELREVARTNAVKVWGYREANGDVVLLARGGEAGRESPRPTKEENDPGIDFVSSDCTFGATRIHAAAVRSGGAAQLRGSLPPVGEGKQKVTPQFVVDASLAKVARDPEPMLAVRVRLLDT